MLNIYGEKEDGYTKRGMAPQSAVDPDMPEDVVRRKGMSEDGYKSLSDDMGSKISLDNKDFPELVAAGRGGEVKVVIKGTINYVGPMKTEIILWDAMVMECEKEEGEDKKEDIAKALMGKAGK
jgi:hypothetical protein